MQLAFRGEFLRVASMRALKRGADNRPPIRAQSVRRANVKQTAAISPRKHRGRQ